MANKRKSNTEGTLEKTSYILTFTLNPKFLPSDYLTTKNWKRTKPSYRPRIINSNIIDYVLTLTLNSKILFYLKLIKPSYRKTLNSKILFNDYLKLIKPSYQKTATSYNIITCLKNCPNTQDTYILTLLISLPFTDMDTSGPKRNVRASLTKKYEARVAETIKKVDPHRATARETLKDVDNLEKESLSGSVSADKVKLAPPTPTTFLEAPLLTLRELMPGGTGDQDPDDDLDQAFRADRIDFIVMHRPMTSNEKLADNVLEDVADVDWEIPEKEEFEDVMGLLFEIYTEEAPELVHAFGWSSVGAATGVGCFAVKTGKRSHIDDIRGALRAIVHEGRCFESFPKKAIMKSFSLTAFFPRATKYDSTDKLIYWLLACNPGLKGTIWPVEARKYPDDHHIPRRRGARVISFSGDQIFLDSLHGFPKDFPFSIKLANVYIRGGERTSKGSGAMQRRRRPRMTEESLKKLLERHGKEIVEEAEDDDVNRCSGNFNK